MVKGSERSMKENKPKLVLSPLDIKQRLVEALLRQYRGEGARATDFVNQQIDNLYDIFNSGSINISGDINEGLMDRLISLGLFPSFSFPLDVATFEAKGSKKLRNEKWSKKYIYARTGQDLKVALVEFQPGKRLTINKQTFLVEGIGLEFPKHPIHHMEELSLDVPRIDPTNPDQLSEGLEEKRFYHRCEEEECKFVVGTTEPQWNLKSDEGCPSCNVDDSKKKINIQSTRMVTPEVFRPRMIPYSRGRYTVKLTADQNLSYQEMRAPEDPEEHSGYNRLGKAVLPTPLGKSINEEGFEELDLESPWHGVKAYRFNTKDDVGTGTELLLVNPGPEGKGFKVCTSCGFVDLTGKNDQGHHRPYSILLEDIIPYVNQQFLEELEKLDKKITTASGEDKKRLKSDKAKFLQNEEPFKGNARKKLQEESKKVCTGEFTNLEDQTDICLGMTFRTDIFLLRIEINEPLNTRWKNSSFEAGFRAIKEALITEVTEELELINREIGGNFRKVPEKDGKQYVDIFLYDNVSGGAGLVRNITGQNLPNILAKVEERLNGSKCIDGSCSRVCIGCLLDFRNKMEADRMDRRLGYQITKHLQENADGPDFRILDVNGINTEVVVNEIETLRKIYPSLKFELKGEFEIEIIREDGTGKRRIFLHSILRGIHGLPEDNPVLYDQTKAYFSKLEQVLIHIPYEIIRDAPNILIESIYPPKSEEEIDDPFDGFEPPM
jgi:hypothetical protein